ncbi:GFA family protein [Sneathiella aquimaris]|uniref:GFA family protein n=1 Tax=Sneathiella aquimaris TaxID=2599305 RepID=UPI00146BF123|nr:GFA family protein [Sneathiella aquimaris]
MTITGRCYCGELTYRVESEPIMKGNCHCRECQYFSGGHPNAFLVMSDSTFQYTKGKPKTFTRSDLEKPRTREFCSNCGTHICTKSEFRPGAIVLKAGTLDDMSLFDKPDMAIFTIDKQPFHHLDADVPSYERMKP